MPANIIRFRSSTVSNANCIVTLECLGANDQKTGRKRTEDLCDALMAESPIEYCDKLGQIEYEQLNNKDQLIDYMQTLTIQAATANKIPLLFIDAHGSESGLCFGSQTGIESIISWPELIDLLGKLNHACKGELTVICAACHSYTLIEHLPSWKRLPFAFYYGYSGEVKTGSLATDTVKAGKSAMLAGLIEIDKTAFSFHSEFIHYRNYILAAVVLATHTAEERKLLYENAYEPDELSIRAISQNIGREVARDGYRTAGLNKGIKSASDSGSLAIVMINQLMYRTERRDILMQDILNHVKHHSKSSYHQASWENPLVL
ncbi:MAG: hypothetical protein V7693_16030 [Halopseudomonas sabulinigri]